MSILVDSSIWIDYFRDGDHSHWMEFLIDENLLVTNDLILAELIPFLAHKKQTRIISVLKEIKNIPLAIDWRDVIGTQTLCLKSGINKVSISDIIIAQNAIQNSLKLYTIDKHFKLMSKIVPLVLYPEK